MAAAILAAVLLGGVRLKNTGAVRLVGTAAAIAATDQGINAIAEATGETASVAPNVEATAVQRRELTDAQPRTSIPPSGVIPTTTTPSILVNGIDLNTATAEQLRSLLPARQLTVRQVQSIIQYRNLHPLQNIDDLKRVSGIGVRTIERLKDLYERDLPLNVFVNQVRDPAQLWATNLGLTKAQARSIIDELQRGGQFRDIDDFIGRMRSKGIGTATVKVMQQRAVLIQQRLVSIPASVP